MARVLEGTCVVLSVLVGVLLGGLPSRAGAAELGSGSPGSASSGNASFPVFELPVPGTSAEQRYLGLSGTGTFRIGQVATKVLLIEVFSFYCPHCQRAAPRMNELYAEIQGRPDLKEKVKLIGIGIGNTNYEVNEFRDRYVVPFPLFSDESREVAERLGIRFTPTLIGINVKESGSPEQFYFKVGGFEDAKEFLAEIVKLSRVE